jgi:DNA helicase-2/ATP-dependent DNA helicase PcrA
LAWDDDLTPEQRAAAGGHNGHIRVLAGPGTGKTFALRARVQYLIEELHIEPSDILIVTFTRKAVAELRERILPCVPAGVAPPRVSTLHGFALRQLLRNAHLVEALPSPLRVADDWEEGEIIIPDLQRLLGRKKNQVKDALTAMSADWNDLNDAELNADPQFVAAWRRVRDVYGFTLRAEMVYRLKRAMEQHDKFELEGHFGHVIVDEFQDLNPCDLSIVRALSNLDASIFCTGDDDQSIYGFRKASPVGIRKFISTYTGVEDHKMTLCRRCDSKILAAAEYVANQDLSREPKKLIAENSGGFVHLFRTHDQRAEADAIAKVCERLKDANWDYPAIVILLRSDYQGRFSHPIIDALRREGIPVSTHRTVDPLSEVGTRRLYSLVQLAVVHEDSLAARALLQLTSGIGEGCIKALDDLAVKRSERFSVTVRAVEGDPTLLPQMWKKVSKAWTDIEAATSKLTAVVRSDEAGEPSPNELHACLSEAAVALGVPGHAVDDLMQLAAQTDSSTLSELLSRSSTVGENLEPQLSTDSVNIMTMHQAKGLTFDCVLIPGLEDELIPGKFEDAEREGDERRLLYVSMTRAKHALALFYTNRRTGAQARSGRGPARTARRLTRFLADYRF